MTTSRYLRPMRPAAHIEAQNAPAQEGRQRLGRRGLIAGAALAAVTLTARSEQVRATIQTEQLQVSNGFGMPLDMTNDAIQGYAVGANNAGVFGRNDSTAGVGVYGVASNGYAVQGQSATGNGIAGVSLGGGGVYGEARGAGIGVRDNPAAGVGVFGHSLQWHGVYGSSDAAPGYGVYGVSMSNHAVTGRAAAVGAAGIYGYAASDTAFAGAFTGNVYIHGGFAVGGTASVAVPHPDGSLRAFYGVGSPDAWLEDFGTGQLAGGTASVTLDADFAAMVRTDDYLVFLTAQGESNGLYAESKTSTGFTVREFRTGAGTATFAYRIVARRKDIKADRLAKFIPPKEGTPPEVIRTTGPGTTTGTPSAMPTPASLTATAPPAIPTAITPSPPAGTAATTAQAMPLPMPTTPSTGP